MLIIERMSGSDVLPNHTIYINNLNEKIKKDGKYGCDGVMACIEWFVVLLDQS